MTDRLRDVLGFEPREIAGSRISGEVPVSDVLINRLIAQRIADDGGAGKISAVVLEALDDNRVTVRVRLRTALVPPLTVHLTVVQQPEFPNLPVLVLRWSVAGVGMLGRLASPALSLFDVLPTWVRVDDDLMAVDVRELARSSGYGELLDFLTVLQISAVASRVLVRFELKVGKGDRESRA